MFGSKRCLLRLQSCAWIGDLHKRRGVLRQQFFGMQPKSTGCAPPKLGINHIYPSRLWNHLPCRRHVHQIQAVLYRLNVLRHVSMLVFASTWKDGVRQVHSALKCAEACELHRYCDPFAGHMDVKHRGTRPYGIGACLDRGCEERELLLLRH